MKKNLRGQFKVLLALILIFTMLMLPFDALALGYTNNGSTPDEMELSATGASLFSGDGSPQSPYLIQSSDDWDALSNHINSGGTDYSGKFFLMTDDITVTTVLGNRPNNSTDSNDNYFSGTFDGDGHELNVNINESGFGAAPFAIAHNATIKNLHVTGTVTSGANHATGLVAASKGRSIYDESYLIIQNVTVSTDISCPSHIAGIVGHAHSADITMENVVFDGSMSASSVQGGMIGWGGLGNGARYSASFKDCLFAGTYNTNAAFYPIAYANGQGTTTLVNDFYTTSFGSGGSPIAPTGDGQLKLLAATVEKDGAVNYFDNFNTAADGSNWTQGSTLKLMADVSNGATITVPSGMHILDLNGHTLLELSTVGKFMVGNGASSTADLTIIDSIGTGVIKHETSRPGSLIWIKEGSSLTLDRGTLEANSSASPVIDFFQQKNASFTMNGGKITGTANNGAVRFGTNCTFTMTGGEISGLQTSTGVFDYSAGSGGAIIISGNPVVKNNTANGTATNFNLPSGRVLTINDEMTDGASIGITTQSGPAAFTSGWKDKMGEADPSKYFTSDDNNYQVLLNGNGEAEIGVPPVASVINGDTTTNYGSLSDAVNAWTAGSTLKLLTDVTTSGTITVPSGEHTLDLNGYGILMTGNDRVVTINQGASLELNDSDPDRIHYITLTNYRGTAVSDSGEESVSNGNGVIKVTGGYLTGGYRNNSGSHDRCGAGVYNWGTFVMNGGSIVGNTLYNNSGGAIRNSGYFTMNGGTIAFNYASGNGGGVTTYVPGGSQGKMTMNGGEISDNYCGSYGGGIQIAGPIEMTGGSVVRNTAGAGGSGVFYDGKNDRFKLSGNPVIKDNSNNDDLYLGANATFMINGSLTEEADIHVLMNTPAEFTVGWKNIMGNADPSKYFTSDDSNYAVILNNNGEAEIGTPPVASVINGDTTTGYGSLSDAVNAWTAGSTLKLMTDVTTSSTITVPSGEHTLDLNGYALKAESAGYSVVTVGSGAELTIDDTSENVGKITGGSVGQNYGGGVTVDGGTLMLKGGAISGNANTHGGIGNCGGGVHVRNGGKFYMEGGEISGNTSYVGGGVCSDTSATTVSITGGVIKNNKTDRFGSAVWAGRSGSAVFRIGGDVQIIDNISTWTADKDGEASLNFVSELLLSGNPTVHGDWKTNGTSAPNSHINLDNDGSGVQRLTLEGALTNDTGAPSITMSPIYRWNDLRNGQTFVFTKNWSQYMGTAHPADYFKLDSGVSGVTVIRKNGEAAFTGSGDLGDLYITFDANEGEGEMDPQLATVTNVTLNENTFTRKDYSFAGWNTKKDGSGTAYDDKANITLSGDLTLYAQWKEPVASIISGDVTTDYGSFSDAVNAWLNASDGATLKLLQDVSYTDKIILTNSKKRVLDLNGKTFTRNVPSGDGTVFDVNSGAQFTLTDTSAEQTGVVTRQSGNYSGTVLFVHDSGSVINFDGGKLTGFTSRVVIAWQGSTVNMSGGEISGNNLNNGDATDGIVRTYSSNSSPGGTFHMTGGRIINNTLGSGKTGGAVYVGNNGTFNLSGDVQISGNTQNGKPDNVYLPSGSKINITDTLAKDASVGVTLSDGTGVFSGGWKANMGDADPSKYFTSDNSDYLFDTVDGEAWLCEEFTGITAKGYQGDYDGKAHGITVSAPDGATIKYGTVKGSYTLSKNPTYTNAGTYTVYYEVSKSGYIPAYGSAQVKITPIDVTVTITGHTLKVGYDGNAHSADGYDATASSTLYDVTKNISYSGRAEAVRTNVGTTQMGLTADKFSNTNDNFAKVTFNVTDGFITIDPVDAEITTAPHAKDQLVYNGSNQTLVEPGTVTGGTLYYALGSDEIIPPSDSQYDQDVPVARNVGNYYIWYKVIADSNHNDLAPACVKVTLAEEGWTTVSGRIYDDNNNPVSNAIVSLTIGGKTVDQIISGGDGGYYFTAPPGLYNIVVKYDGATVTDMIDIDESTTYDVSIFDANTDSFLNIVGFDSNIVVGGLNKEAEAVRAREGVSSDKNVTVSMTVTPIDGGGTYAAAAIEEYASDRNVLYYDFEVEETVDMITTYLDRTQTVLEIAIPCSFVNKQELAVYTSDGSSVETLTESDTKAAGTYRVDTSAGLVYIYTDEITTYALGYKPYYSVTSDVSLGSYTGVVSVTLTKDGDTIYELNDVSMDNISFRGVPKGTYSMTITWTDGAENTITTPFEIK